MAVKAVRIPVGAGAYWSVLDEDLRFAEPFDAYLRHLRFGRGRAESTTRRYAESLATFANWCETTGRNTERGLVELHGFVTWLRFTPIERPGRSQGQPRSDRRINGMLAAVRECAKHAVHTDTLPDRVLSALWEVSDDRSLPADLRPEGTGLRYRAKPRHRLREDRAAEPAAATEDEVAALIGAARSWRDRFIIWLLWTCGLRAGGALGLRRSDLHLVDDARPLGCQLAVPHLHVVAREDNPNGAAAKGRSYHVPVRDDLLGLYEQYLGERERVPAAEACDFVLVNLFHEPYGSPMTYDGLRDLLERLSKSAELSRVVRPHMLRHGAGRSWVVAGADLAVVQKLLGHAWLSSTQIYITPDTERLRRAVASVPSLRGPK